MDPYRSSQGDFYITRDQDLRNSNLKQKLDDYEFVIDQQSKFKSSDLGSGAYGKVKRVREIASGAIYAMKILSKQAMSRTSNHDNLKTEIMIHRTLDHPHIVKLHNYFEDEEYVYIVLEYAENKSLFDHIKTGFPENDTFIFFFQTCLGIHYLHSRKIIHRDLKPENLLLDKNNNIKICDFGWSAQSQNMRQTYCGTIDYMAPEILRDLPYDHRVDIWSLGILLYELLHGCVPFSGQTDQQKSQSIAGNAPIKFSPRISGDVYDLIKKILKQDPRDRPTMDEIFSHPWMRKHDKLYNIDIKAYLQRQELESGNVKQESGKGNRAYNSDAPYEQPRSTGGRSTQADSRSGSESYNSVRIPKTGTERVSGLKGEYWWRSAEVPILGANGQNEGVAQEREQYQQPKQTDKKAKPSRTERITGQSNDYWWRSAEVPNLSAKGQNDPYDVDRGHNSHTGFNSNSGNKYSSTERPQTVGGQRFSEQTEAFSDIGHGNSEIERQLMKGKKGQKPNMFEHMLMGIGIISKNKKNDEY